MDAKKEAFSIRYLVLIFILIYTPFLKFGGIVIHLPYFYSAALALVFLGLILYRRKVSKVYINFTLLYWLTGVWVFLVGIINGNLDNTVIFGYVLGTLSIFAAYPIVWGASKKVIDVEIFIVKAVYMSGLAHSLIMILGFFWGPFRTLLYSIVPLGESGGQFVELMIRSPGLTTGGGDSLSIIQALALMFGIYYLMEIRKRTSFLGIVKHFLSFTCLFLSILLSARTGLVIIFVFLAWLIIVRMWHFLLKKKVSPSFIKKSIISVLILSVFVPVGYNYIINSEYSRFANRAFELYLNYIETGTIGSSSSDKMKDMVVFPEDSMHLWMGDGNFGRNEKLPNVASDIGFIRIIHGVGIIGGIALFLPLVYICVMLLRRKKLAPHLVTLTLITIAVIIIANMKLFYYFEFRESFKVLFLLIATLTISNTRVKLKVQEDDISL